MRTLLVLLLVAVAILADLGRAEAIPSFARRYGFSCSTCHTGGPYKLSSFGEAFRFNGYRIPGNDEAFVRQPPIPLGNPARASLFPDTVWPGELPASPLGVYVALKGAFSEPPPASTQPRSLDIEPAMCLLIGGSLSKHITFFGGIAFELDEGVGVEWAVFVFRSLFERALGESRLNLKIGRMDADLFAHTRFLRRSILIPLPLALQVGRDGFALGRIDGFELYGQVGGRLQWMVGGANGYKPHGEFGSRRDLLGRLSFRLGGRRIDYRGAPAEAGEGVVATLGVSAYSGVGVFQAGPLVQNEIARWMGDVRLQMGGLDLIGQFVLGTDSNPNGDARRVQHIGWYGEADYEVYPWFHPFARFEELRFDDPMRPERRRIVMGLSVYVRANVRLRVEGAIGLANEEPHVALAEVFVAM